jgi:hypothetical protein
VKAKLAALAAAAVVLAGCTASPTPPATSEPAPVETVATPTATAEPTRGMSLADGRPMLWGINMLEYTGESGTDIINRLGFVTATGERIESKYLSYDYCLGADGNPTRVVVSTPTALEVLALTGERTAEIPVEHPYFVSCVADRIIAAYNNEWNYRLDDTTAAYDLKTNKFLDLPAFLTASAPLQEDTFLDYLASVAEPDRPFCLNDDDEGEPGQPNRFMSVTGQVLSESIGCGRFHGNYAEVEDVETESSYLVDRSLNVVPEYPNGVGVVLGPWDEPVAYWGTDSNGVNNLLDLDLNVLASTDVERGIDCEDGSLWCGVVNGSGLIVVDLTTGEATGVPGFSNPIALFATNADRTRAYSLATGAQFDLPSCTDDWYGWDRLTCQWEDNDHAFWASGARSSGSVWVKWWYAGPQIPTGIVYFAQTARYQGYVDANGDWLYKESVYQELRD